MNQKTCWVVCDTGKVGTEHQCVGLAEALGYQPLVKRLTGRGVWRYLPPSLWLRPLSGVLSEGSFLMSPWPDLIIAAGRLSVAPTAYIRRITQGKTRVIQLQNPRINPGLFDAVIAPWHDRLTGDNVYQTRGALHRVTSQRLAAEAELTKPLLSSLPKPLIAVLIGGNNSCYKMTPEILRQMAQRLRTLADHYQAGLAVVVSRRTPKECYEILRQELKSAYVWTGEGYNPYYGVLALADFIILTSDSVSMASEACFTGKPVYTYFLPGGSRKFNAFHQYFQKHTYTRPFEDKLETWSYPPLDEFTEVSLWLEEKLKKS